VQVKHTKVKQRKRVHTCACETEIQKASEVRAKRGFAQACQSTGFTGFAGTKVPNIDTITGEKYKD
jgi:hypothetical protein